MSIDIELNSRIKIY